MTDTNTFENQTLLLHDVFRAEHAQGRGVIQGKTFKNCRIEGPAVMLVLGDCSFENTNFGYNGGDMRNIVLRPESPTHVIGTIPVVDCKFLGCEFFMLGFTGRENFLTQVLALQERTPGA